MDPHRWALEAFLRQRMKRTENTQDTIPSQALSVSDSGQTQW